MGPVVVRLRSSAVCGKDNGYVWQEQVVHVAMADFARCYARSFDLMRTLYLSS